MKIATKILLGFGIMIVLVWLIGIFAVTSFSHSSSLFNKMDTDTIPRLIAAGDMSQKLTEAHVEFMEFLLSGKISSRDNVAALLRTLTDLGRDNLEQYKDLGADEKQSAEELTQKINIFSSSVTDVMDMKTRGLTDEELLAAEEKSVRPTFDSMMALLADQNADHKAELSGMRNDVKSSQSRGLLITIIIAVIAMFTGILLAVVFGRSITRPITHLTAAADGISKGDISRAVTRESADEIGDLAEAFERMRISLKVMIEEEGE
ncbi:MAG: MCP four helix bundle domain-containing protein [Candidatus Aminicenantes bacterium]|nr:MCP four helix bundle domain-containing protein [Candidatus Aminicenantes bacterium]